MTAVNPLPQLQLPKRWELLAQRAQESGLDPSQFVERVDAAAARIDLLLNRVRTGGGGLFEVFFGLSGSGKTTFLRTLPKFFHDIRVHPFPKEQALADLPRFVTDTYVEGNKDNRIILVERRDNPKDSDLSAAREMFADLLEVFRTPQGNALVIWPLTRNDAATDLAMEAWSTGRDSVTEASTKGLYVFDGLPKEKYAHVADQTSRNLTGDGLEAFGITEDIITGLLPQCVTIADFFAAIDRTADEQRNATWSVLRERVRARLWVLLPGDVIGAINATVSALTQGTRRRIDIDLIGEFIDKPENNALYVADWRARRASLAHLLRTLDVRLFGVPPNVALAAIRAYGDESLRKLLNQGSTNLEQAKDALKASQFYKAVLSEAGVQTSEYAGAREVSAETSNEYRRIQAVAANNDKPLNRALGRLLEVCLLDDAKHLTVVAEKRSLPGSSLQPDLQIKMSETDFICLEPTWRSTAVGIPDELEGGQNTLAEAHIKKYVLEKAMQFVRDLGL